MKDHELDLIIPRRKALRELLMVSSTTAWSREKSDRDWPQPVPIGPKRYGYRISDIKHWLDTRSARATRPAQ